MGTVLKICMGSCQAVVSLRDVQVELLNEIFPSDGAMLSAPVGLRGSGNSGPALAPWGHLEIASLISLQV